MNQVKRILISLVFLFGIPAIAQQSGPPDKTVQISGTILSLSGNILDVKPAASPAVWVTIPADLHVDRSALKEGANVSAQAYWADTCYVATQISVQK